ncbi:ABC transporter permease [Streptomyces sp. NPDC052042]|uniref:ABC transporter permease n=1 Tax=Streptomyces sp. NPDC052042 TaxID=3365683 RepID=UPI0037D192CA
MTAVWWNPVLRRVGAQAARLVFVVFGVTSFLFLLSHLAGDPAELYAEPSATPEMLEATRARLGLDEPLAAQYWNALVSSFTFRFPPSYTFGGPVEGLVLGKLGLSLVLVGVSITLACVIALALGVVGALYPTRLLGRAALFVSYVTAAVPYFVLPLILILLFSIRWRLLPAGGDTGLESYVIPVAALTFMGYATLSRLVRSELLDVFTRGYIETARSKGISPWRVLALHGLPGAAPPVLAWVGIEFSYLFGALLVVEPLMNFNGIGSFLLNGVAQRDFPVVQTAIVSIAILVTLVNGLIDITVTAIDPRTKTGAET